MSRMGLRYREARALVLTEKSGLEKLQTSGGYTQREGLKTAELKYRES
jgi:hypothetical protein